MCSGGAKNPSGICIFFFADMVSILHLITMTMNYTVVDIQGSGELMEGNVEFVATHGTQNRYVILRYILNAVVFCQPSSVLRSGKRARSGLRGLFLGPVLLEVHSSKMGLHKSIFRVVSTIKQGCKVHFIL